MQLRVALCLLPLTVRAANIVSSNDDGWAEVNLHTLYNALTNSGHSVVVSAPADNKSGTGKHISAMGDCYNGRLSVSNEELNVRLLRC